MTTEAQKRASIKYAKGKLKRVPLDLNKEYYEGVLVPAASAAGLSINAYIKEAIAEKIEKTVNLLFTVWRNKHVNK